MPERIVNCGMSPRKTLWNHHSSFCARVHVRTCSSLSCSNAMLRAEQELLLRFPVLLRRPLDAAFGEELPAAENERHQNSGFGIRIAGPRTGSLRDPQRLAQR